MIWAGFALGSLVLAGCSSSSDVHGPPPSAGWVTEVVLHPDAFAALLDSEGRDGWIALHQNDPRAAAPAFAPHALGRARADLELVILHEDLARLSHETNARLFETWAKKGGLPAGAAASVARLADLCDPGGFEPWHERATVHALAEAGNVDALVAVAADPIAIEQGPGFERQFYDPCIDRSLAVGFMARLGEDLGVPPRSRWQDNATALATPTDAELAQTLFAPWLTRGDLAAEAVSASAPGVLGATMPSLDLWSVQRPLPATDRFDAGRDEARAVTAVVDGWNSALAHMATDDGRAVLTDLDVAERFRQEWLVARGRLALVEDHPQHAMSLLELAHHAGEPLGPKNPPGLYALLAEARLRTGRTREALDALAVLADAYPEVHGLFEALGDLAVLEGLDRPGDSKEE